LLNNNMLATIESVASFLFGEIDETRNL